MSSTNRNAARQLRTAHVPEFGYACSPIGIPTPFYLQLPEAASIHVAYCVNGTFSHLLEHADALAMLKSTYQALRPGGLLVIEDINPDFMFDGR